MPLLTFREFVSEELIRPDFSLGLERKDMPQVAEVHYQALLDYLEQHGVSHRLVTVSARQLKPVQGEINGEKVRSLPDDAENSSKRPLVSKDGYVLDGHHTWMHGVWKDKPLRCLQFNANIRPLLALLHRFPHTEYRDIQTVSLSHQ